MSLTLQLAKAVNRIASMSPVRLIPGKTQRFMSSRKCAPDEGPRCGNEKLSKSPCMANKKKGEKKKPKPDFSSMWENPDCCKDPCPEVLPRFDELYYRPSDKAKREYKQTWVECPEKKIVQKAVCEFKNLKYPPLEKRPRKSRPKTACSNASDSKLLMKCQKKANLKCVKITLPGCRGVRDPPKCKRERGPSDCLKICCPYPSFSECKKPAIKPKRPVECNCLRLLSMCDVWAELRRRMANC